MPDSSQLTTSNAPLPGANTDDSAGVSSPQDKTEVENTDTASDTSSQWEGTVYGRVDVGASGRKDLFGYDEFLFEPNPKTSATLSGTVGAELSRHRFDFRLGVTGRMINPSTYTYEGDYRDLVIHTAPQNRLGFVPDTLELGGEFGPFYHVSENVSIGLLTGLRFYLSPMESNIGVNHKGEFIGTVPDGSPDAHNPLGERALFIGPQVCYRSWCVGVNSSFRQKTESDERFRDRRIENAVTFGWQGHFGRKAAAPVARSEEVTEETAPTPPSVEKPTTPAEPTFPTAPTEEEGPPIISTEPAVTEEPLLEDVDQTLEAAEKQKISTEIQDFNQVINSIDFVEIEKYVESLTQEEAGALFDSGGHLRWSHIEHLLNNATDPMIVDLAGNYLDARLYERYLELHSETGQAEREIYENALKEWESFSKPKLEKVGLVTLGVLPGAMGVLVYQSESWMKNFDEVPLDELRNRQRELKGVEQYEAALLATLLGLVEKVDEWKLETDRQAAAAAEREKQEIPVEVAKKVAAARQTPSPKGLEQALLPLITPYYARDPKKAKQVAETLSKAVMQASRVENDTQQASEILEGAKPAGLEGLLWPILKSKLNAVSKSIKEGRSMADIDAQVAAMLSKREGTAEAPESTPTPAPVPTPVPESGPEAIPAAPKSILFQEININQEQRDKVIGETPLLNELWDSLKRGERGRRENVGLFYFVHDDQEMSVLYAILEALVKPSGSDRDTAVHNIIETLFTEEDYLDLDHVRQSITIGRSRRSYNPTNPEHVAAAKESLSELLKQSLAAVDVTTEDLRTRGIVLDPEMSERVRAVLLQKIIEEIELRFKQEHWYPPNLTAIRLMHSLDMKIPNAHELRAATEVIFAEKLGSERIEEGEKVSPELSYDASQLSNGDPFSKSNLIISPEAFYKEDIDQLQKKLLDRASRVMRSTSESLRSEWKLDGEIKLTLIFGLDGKVLSHQVYGKIEKVSRYNGSRIPASEEQKRLIDFARSQTVSAYPADGPAEERKAEFLIKFTGGDYLEVSPTSGAIYYLTK